MRKPFDVLARFLPLYPPFASLRETNECTGRQDNAGTVYIAEWTEERDEARVGEKKREEGDITNSRALPGVGFFAFYPFAFISAFVLPPNPYKDEDEQKEKRRRKGGES